MRRAAIANIRPKLAAAENADGRARQDRIHGELVLARTLRVCSSRKSTQFFAQAGPRVGENGDGQQRGIDRAGFADGEGADGDAAGHLHDREQRIHALERMAFDGHAEHGQQRLRGDHPGRCAAPPAPAMITSMPRDSAEWRIRPCTGCAVGGDDLTLMRDAELRQHFRRRAAWFPNRTCCP